MPNDELFNNPENKSTPPSLDVISSSAAQLSLMEIGLGSFLHAFHIPFSGFFLSLNQCFVLNRALLHPHSPPFLPITISNIAAIVKTLSPYGKKFTPMLAISMQGLLFNIGAILFGNNLLGRCIGSLLLSLWPMVQPILIYGVIYGSFFLSIDQITAKIPWLYALTLYIFIHISLSLTVCLLTHLLPTKLLDSYDRYITSYSSSHLKPLPPKTKNSLSQKLKGVGRDFLSPIFLLSLTLSGFLFYATVHSLDLFFLLFFRLIAVAFLTFFFIRTISSEWCIRIFSKCCLSKKYTPYVEEILQRWLRH